jgi:hypothetical protein
MGEKEEKRKRERKREKGRVHYTVFKYQCKIGDMRRKN